MHYHPVGCACLSRERAKLLRCALLPLWGKKLRGVSAQAGADIVEGLVQARRELGHAGDDAESEHGSNHRVLDQILTFLVVDQIPEPERQHEKYVVHRSIFS